MKKHTARAIAGSFPFALALPSSVVAQQCPPELAQGMRRSPR
jgi:hypothetical protein